MLGNHLIIDEGTPGFHTVGGIDDMIYDGERIVGNSSSYCQLET